MMQLHVAGRLVRNPEAKTSKNGKGYVQALLLVPAGDIDILVTAMAFDPEVQAVLTGLKKGDSCSAGGAGSIRAYTDKEGLPAAGVNLMVNRLMALTEMKAEATSAAKAKASPARNGQRRVEGQYSVDATEPTPEPTPVNAYNDDIPF